MNVDERIRKKEQNTENKKKILKKIIIPLLVILLLAGVVYYLISTGVFTKINNNDAEQNENNEQNIDDGNIEEKDEISTEEQIEGIQNGTSTVKYKDYTYVHTYDENDEMYKVTRYKNGEDTFEDIISYQSQGWMHSGIWIYKDKLYIQQNDLFKRYNIDGTDEQTIVTAYSSQDVQVDFNSQIIVYPTHNESTYEFNINIANLDGEAIKTIYSNEFGGNFDKIFKIDSENIIFTTRKSGGEAQYGEETNILALYLINKENYELSKVVEETLTYGWYGCDFYQVESYEDYIYYVAGSQDGTGGYFYGSLYRVKKDGSDRVDILSNSLYEYTDYLGELTTPTFIVKNGFLYYSGVRINLSTLEQTRDYYTNGDVIDDDDYVYTTSMSNDNKIVLSKYKAGSDNAEDIQTLFENDIPEGAYSGSEKTSLTIEGDYIYLSITYTDYDNTTQGRRAWTGYDYLSETYKIKKDGSSAIKI